MNRPDMQRPLIASIVAFVTVITLVAALAWLTASEEPDPCQDLRGDMGAAVLADQAGDQDALVNRAIIVRGKCEQNEQDQ